RQVVGFDSVPLCHGSAIRYRVDGEHLDATAPGDATRELSHWSKSHHDDGVSGLGAGIVDALPRGRRDVAEEQVALVRESPAHHDGVRGGQFDAQELSLATGDLAVELRVAVEAGTRSVFA